MNRKKTKQPTIKMEPVDEKFSIFIDFNKESCKEHPKLKVRDHVRKSKYKKYFCKMLNSKMVWRSFCD